MLSLSPNQFDVTYCQIMLSVDNRQPIVTQM